MPLHLLVFPTGSNWARQRSAKERVSLIVPGRQTSGPKLSRSQDPKQYLSAMKTSVLRRQTKRIGSTGQHPDLRAVAAAAASERMKNEVVESPPLPACNFPEILARDLEMSEATFLAKSMTAGAPIRSLATPEGERRRKQQKPLHVGAMAAKSSHVHWEEDTLSKECGLGVIDEASYHSNASDNGTPSEVASLTSDSGSDSLADMGPPSVRTRQQSVCTAATSVMAHCLPSKEQPRYSLVAFEETYQGQSWIDLDIADSEDDEEEHPGEAQTARPCSPTKRRTQDDVVPQKGTVDAFTSSSGSNRPPAGQDNDLLPAQAQPLDKILASLLPSSFHAERPRSSSGISVLDKPHQTTRQFHSHKRSSSSELTSRSLFEFQASYPRSWASTSTTLASQGSKFDHEILRREAYPAISPRGKRLQAEMASPRHNANDQWSTTSRLATTHEANNTSNLGKTQVTRLCISEVDDEPTATESIDEYARSERHEDQPDGAEADTSVTDSVLANERMSRIDIPQQLYQEMGSGSSQPTLNPPRMNPPETSTQGPQAPPTTTERADSSDSSIDETFFRSKIVLPEAGDASRPSTRLPPPSAIPTTSSPYRPATRATPMNMRLHPDVFSRLETSIAGFPDTMLSTKALPIELIRSLPKSRSYNPSSSTSFSALDLALEQPDSTPLPSSSHKWKVPALRSRHPNPPPPPPPKPVSLLGSGPSSASIIQRIFPFGNDLHCDALYAHLIAYLYISTLCGPDSFSTSNSPISMSRPTAPVYRATNPSRNLMHNPIPRNDEPSIAVPPKASSFLGMGTTTTPTPDPRSTARPPKLSKMRSLLSFNGRVGGKCAKPREGGEEGGRMVPAKASPPTGRSKPATERDVREVQAGLLRCVRNLVAKLRGAAGGVEGEGGVAMLREDDFEVDDRGWRTLDPYFLRALCEIVRAEEEKFVAGVMA